SISGAGFMDMPPAAGADMAAGAGFAAGFFAWPDETEAYPRNNAEQRTRVIRVFLIEAPSFFLPSNIRNRSLPRKISEKATATRRFRVLSWLRSAFRAGRTGGAAGPCGLPASRGTRSGRPRRGAGAPPLPDRAS